MAKKKPHIEGGKTPTTHPEYLHQLHAGRGECGMIHQNIVRTTAGRYNKKGTREKIINRRVADGRGAYHMRGEKWTHKRDDALLESYLEANNPLTSPDPRSKSFQSELGRTDDGVGTRLRKLAARHKDARGYRPVSRTDRTEKPFTDRDFYILQIAMREQSRKQGSLCPKWLGVILGRSQNRMEKTLDYLANMERPVPEKANLGLFKKEVDWDAVARVLRRFMKSASRLKQLIHNIPR